MSIFYPLEVVGGGSETQFQVGGNLDELTKRRRVKYSNETKKNPLSYKFSVQYTKVHEYTT